MIQAVSVNFQADDNEEESVTVTYTWKGTIIIMLEVGLSLYRPSHISAS